jgi:hypothetical protein
MSMADEIIYNIDTSTLIYLEKYYPRSHFELIWKNLERIFKEGKIYVTDNVWKEIQDFNDKDDPLVLWMKDRKDISVKSIKDIHTIKAAEIIKNNPEIVKDNISVGSAVKENADPYIIAHSFIEGTTVLTGEKNYENIAVSPKKRKIRIPHICEKYNVPCVSLQQADQEAIIPLFLIRTFNLNTKYTEM